MVMGFEGWKGGVCSSWGFKSLTRRKQVDSVHGRSTPDGHHQLAKALSATHLVAIGVGTTIGAGVYILVGTVARELSGPALMFSFLIAGIAAALSAFCYAELASRCPSAGSAYHYSYICVGEGVAWLVGWALILEYTIGGAAVARGITPNLSLLFGGHNSLPSFLARHYVPGLDLTIDPAAAILVLIATGLLCAGIRESTVAQGIVTTANVCAMLFIITAGGYLGFKSGWVGYELSTGFFPFGFNGMLAGSATVFFAYIGFDAVASTAEEVKNPKRDLPIGIGVALTICCTLYMLVSVVVVGLVPYYAMDPDTPISSAFASHGMQWAVYVITIGAVMALCSTLLGSLLPQPRVFMAMARDGLLPSFFSDVNRHTRVPVKSTIVTGICAGTLAFFMEVSQLAGMVSVGTLLAFTMVAVSVLILRYVPPDEIPLPLSVHGSLEYASISSNCSKEIEADKQTDHIGSSKDMALAAVEHPLLLRQVGVSEGSLNEDNRRKIAGWTITVTCVGVIILACFASVAGVPSYLRFSLCGIGAVLIVSGLVILSCIDQDEARHSFGHAGGFTCPFVPFLPVACILVNCYLMVNLGTATWIRVSVWLLMGVLIYAFYGRNHSTLQDAIYVPAVHADEIYRISRKDMA